MERITQMLQLNVHWPPKILSPASNSGVFPWSLLPHPILPTSLLNTTCNCRATKLLQGLVFFPGICLPLSEQLHHSAFKVRLLRSHRKLRWLSLANHNNYIYLEVQLLNHFSNSLTFCETTDCFTRYLQHSHSKCLKSFNSSTFSPVILVVFCTFPCKKIMCH